MLSRYENEVMSAVYSLCDGTDGCLVSPIDILESINRLHGKKTLVIIAHRLQTIEKCDLVYRVEDGKILKEERRS